MKKAILLFLIVLNVVCMSEREACVENNKINELDFKADACLFIYSLGESYKNESTKPEDRETDILIGKAIQNYIGYSCLESARRAKHCNSKSPLIPKVR